MLNFFTNPYEEEIFYSTIARYHYYSGNLSFKETLREIFGSESVIPSVEFPSRLAYFTDQLPKAPVRGWEHFLENNTMLPFYAPFLPAKRLKEIKWGMQNDLGKNLYTKIGYVAGGICRTDSLKYCPLCVNDDLQNIGESYFRRLHQLQGILICPVHYCLLKRYPVLKYERSRLEFIRLQPTGISLRQEYEKNEKVSYSLLKIAEGANFLRFIQKDYDMDWVHRKYLALLNDKGFVTVNRHIKQRELCQTFNEYYGTQLLSGVESSLELGNTSNWLELITRKPRRVIHPIRNIMFIIFLAGSLEEFFDGKIQSKLHFGEAPWPCLNPVSEHYKQPVVYDCQITTDSKSRKPVGTFSCVCGFVYSRKGPDLTTEDRFKVGRIKQFGNIWGLKLKQYIELEHQSLRGMARLMKCDPKTIAKFAQNPGLSSLANTKSVNNFRVMTKAYPLEEKYKLDIIELTNNEPYLNRKQVRERLNKQYAYLYRHDRAWLGTNMPARISHGLRNTNHNCKVDWRQRDLEITGRLADVLGQILSEEKPVRITKSLLGRKLGKALLLETSLMKLPRTRGLLDIVVETTDDFRVRRVEVIFRNSLLEGRRLKKWELERLAGLRKGYSNKILATINNLTNRE